MKKKDIKSAKKKERKIKKIEADGLQNLFHQKNKGENSVCILAESVLNPVKVRFTLHR